MHVYCCSDDLHIKPGMVFGNVVNINKLRVFLKEINRVVVIMLERGVTPTSFN